MNLPCVPVLFGPTASGKSGLALKLAAALDGEVINADSRQIYTHMPIITACPTAADYAECPHHLYEFLDPRARYSAGAYAKQAVDVIADVLARGKQPIVVGGTGFYLRALMEGISPLPEVPHDLASKVENEVAEDTAAAYARLQQVDAAWAARVSPTDTQRIVRGLAVWQATDTPLSHWQSVKGEGAPYTFLRLALNPPRETLHGRITLRWQQMLDAGVVEEIAALKDAGYTPDLPALNGLGIAELFAYLEGTWTLEAAVEAGVTAHRQYAKRQISWLNNQYAADITWANADAENVVSAVAERVAARAGQV